MLVVRGIHGKEISNVSCAPTSSDNFFATRGQDFFRLEIIDWVKPKGTNGWYGDVYGKSHRLEDFWMKKLKTRTKDGRGGQNTSPAGIPFS